MLCQMVINVGEICIMKERSEMQELGEENGLISNMLIRETFVKKVAFEQIFGGGEGVNDACIWEL